MEIPGNNFKRNKNLLSFPVVHIFNIILLIATKDCEDLDCKWIQGDIWQIQRLKLLSGY